MTVPVDPAPGFPGPIWPFMDRIGRIKRAKGGTIALLLDPARRLATLGIVTDAQILWDLRIMGIWNRENVREKDRVLVLVFFLFLSFLFFLNLYISYRA
jgi:hypothetical protein